MKRVLVTGATGFVGRPTLPLLLARGFDVHAVTSRADPAAVAGVRWHRLHLLDCGEPELDSLLAAVRPTHLLHLAWYAEPGKFWDSPLNERWVEASLRLLRAFGAVGGQRAALAGTCAEYDWSGPVLSEIRTATRPATRYGRAKLALLGAATELCAGAGISLAWGRIFFLYGAGEPPGKLVAGVIRALLAGAPALCSEGTQQRDFLYVADVAAAFAALADSDATGAFNIASGEAIAVREVTQRIAERLGRPDLLRLGALPMQPGEPPRLVGDNARLRAHTDWRPRIDLAQGLERSIAYWRAQAGVCDTPASR